MLCFLVFLPFYNHSDNIKHLRKPDQWHINRSCLMQNLQKSLWVLQKAHIKIVTCSLFTYLYFLFIFFFLHTLSSPVIKWNVIVITVLLSKLDHRLMFKYIYYKPILVWGLVSLQITNNYFIPLTPKINWY